MRTRTVVRVRRGFDFGAKAIARLVLVVFAAAVVGVIYTSWRGRPEREVAEPPAPSSAGGSVVSRTSGLSYTSLVNGVKRYELQAGERLGFRNNSSEFGEGVSLVIFGAPTEDGGPVEETQVRAERLEVEERVAATEADRYEEIRLLDNVRAVLPSGVEFSSDVLVYRSGVLTTNRGVLLDAGGLVVEAATLNYDPTTKIGRLSGAHADSQRPDLAGNVKLWTNEAGTAAVRPPADGGLQGYADLLIYDLPAAQLQLRVRPVLLLPEAELTGAQIELGLDDASTGISSIVAQRRARAVWLGSTSPGEQVAEGDAISVDLEDGRPRGLRVTSEGTPRPRFRLGDAGELRADLLELAFGDAAAGAVSASGNAFFFPSSNESGLENISADSLTVGSGGLAELVADGNVKIEVVTEGTETVTFEGPRARFAYEEDRISSADWPAGIRHEGEGRTVTAGQGTFEPETNDWVLNGMPRPEFRSGEFDVQADEIRLRPEGAFQLTGAVKAQLRGDVINTLGPLFGGATQIEAAADELQVSADDRLTFDGNASVWQGTGEQLLRADQIKLLTPSNEMQAAGNVFVSLIEKADSAQEEGAEPRTILLTGRQLLVEGTPLRLVLAGEALLQFENDARTVGGERLTVNFADAGGWESMEVETAVVMSDPAGTGQGERLEFDADTGLVVIYAGLSGPATFVNEEGIDIRDNEGLRLEWNDTTLSVTAMQNGTTQTMRSGQD